MHYFGYLIYAMVIAAIAFVPAANTLVVTSYNLATEITIGCLVVAAYPPLQFAYYHLRGYKGAVHFERMCSVSATCGNTVVSLGLIGTFVGLTQMIEKIAGAIGGEGGSLDEQIAIIMTAIGESLDAMSFAFLTSVMGVAASVVIFAATVYFKMFFDKIEDESDENVSDEAMEARLDKMELQSSKVRQYMVRMINGNVDRKEMASILVNNSQQLRTVTDVAGKLTLSVENQVNINSELTNAVHSLATKMDQILENQAAILKFGSGSFEKLNNISNKTDSLVEGDNTSIGHLETLLDISAKSAESLVAIDSTTAAQKAATEESESKKKAAIATIAQGLTEMS